MFHKSIPHFGVFEKMATAFFNGASGNRVGGIG